MGVWDAGEGNKVTRLLYLGLLPLGCVINWLILCEVLKMYSANIYWNIYIVPKTRMCTWDPLAYMDVV